MTMNNDLLQRYLEGNATEKEREEVLLWIEMSEENRKEYMRLRRLYDFALISDRELLESKTHRHSYTRILRWGISVAATLVIGFCAWSVYRYSLHRDVQAEIPKMQIVEVGVGQQVKLTLPDSTVVILNSNSKFSYPTSFGTESRVVTLDGEGYFDVCHDESHPFIVRTKQFDVKVLGTVFNVMAYSNSPAIETTLLEGSVQMSSFDNEYSVRLRPLQKASYVDQVGLTISTIDTTDVVSWKEGIITFKDEPLSKVFQSLEQYYRVKFIFERQQMDHLYCTGKFAITSDIDHIVKVLAKANSFSYEMKEDNTLILIQ